MGLDFSSDMDVFYNTSDFAVAATLTANGVVSTPAVIFDEDYVETYSQGTAVGNSQPACTMKASAYTVRTSGDTIVISGSTYSIARREPIEDGLQVRLFLVGA